MPAARFRAPMARRLRTTCAAAFAALALAACGGGGGGDAGVTPPTQPPPSPTPAAIEVVSGNQQRGLAGRPLADSLTVRVRTATGSAVPGATVAWSASAGTLSGTSTTTDASGIARVQWSPGSGDGTASATVAGFTASFTANGRASASCQLQPSAGTRSFSLGPTDFTLSLRATMPLRVAVVFVDYPDAVATETPASIMNTVVTPGVAMLEEMSYGRIDLTPVAFPTWYRMPQPIAAYDWTTFAGHRAFMIDVIAATTAAVDFSTFDALYVFSPLSPSRPTSVTFNGGTTFGVVADGRTFGNAVTYGSEPRSSGPAITAHETGHMLGLLDLYAFAPAGGTNYPGIPRKHVGSWSLMSNFQNPTHFLAWEKRKLGWVDDDQVDCLDGGAGGVEVVLTPNHVSGGRKIVVMPIDAGSALVAEVRASAGLDANLCATGVLLYTVDARIATGAGPVQVLGSRVTTSGAEFARCGPWPDATFGVGGAAVSTWTDATLGMSVSVVAAESGGAYRVRVKRTT